MKITLDHLTKKFPNRAKNKPDVIAVNDFTFEIPDGKLVGLLGPSGCGKSTVLNLICGLLKATDGKIYFDDDDVTNIPAEYRGVGIVFQNYALYPHLTVEKNIMFPLENFKGAERLSKEEMKKRALEAAKLVQIDQLMERKPAELSGGQQQRVAIARALVKQPRVLLMDEPLSNLDARLRLQTREEIRRIQRETKITTIFVTHDQEEAMSISDLIVVMKDGVLQQIGKPQQIYDEPCNLFVAKFLGTPPVNVFHSKVQGGKLLLGSDAIFSADLPDQEVWCAIRPEAFTIDEHGPMRCALHGVEIMGRDVSVVAGHPALDGVQMRAITPSARTLDDEAETVRFRLDPEKVLLFSKADEKRIPCELA